MGQRERPDCLRFLKVLRVAYPAVKRVFFQQDLELTRINHL